jgi:RNA polymerase sigma factor (sigma-70 family)
MPTPLSIALAHGNAATESLPGEPDTRLRGYLRRRFPRLPDIEDLVQEAHLRLWRAKRAGNVRSERGLLFSIARHAAFDSFRRHAKHPTERLPEDPDSAVYLDDANAADITSRQEEVALLRQALAALPERCREVLVLRRIHALSHREIAERLGIAEHTVEKQVGIGLRKCLDFLRRHGVDPRRA